MPVELCRDHACSFGFHVHPFAPPLVVFLLSSTTASASLRANPMAESADPLTAVLSSLRLAGSISCYSQLKAPWGIAIPQSRGVVFHAVLRGRCWVTPQPGAPPIALATGDLAVFPRGQPHVLADEPGRPTMSVECLVRSRWLVEGRLQGGGDGAETRFICGEFSVDQQGKHPLWSQLPAFLHLRRGQTATAPSSLSTTLRQLAAEVRRPRLGSELVVTRLLDVLVVEIVRHWLARQHAVSVGWLGGMRDERIGAALALIHERPDRDWTVASLASEVGTSRTVFAERFAALVGESPLAYVTRVRMQVAATRFRLAPGSTMIAIAETVGYRSEAAFGKAFKRLLGISPGSYRRAIAAEGSLARPSLNDAARLERARPSGSLSLLIQEVASPAGNRRPRGDGTPAGS